jgi:hypothetical protein
MDNQMLTVGELKALLAGLPDVMGVCAVSEGHYRVKVPVSFRVEEVDQRQYNSDAQRFDAMVVDDHFPGRTLVVYY